MGQQRRIHRVLFRDRDDAGNVLAVQLAHYAGRASTVVLGLPRGGISVAYSVAHSLGAPLDVLLFEELRVPGKTRPDLPIGLVAGGGVRIVDARAVAKLGIRADELDRATTAASLELARREHVYHGYHDRVDLRGQTVIVIDEGLDGGSRMKSALDAVRQQEPERVVIASPVASLVSCSELASRADEVVWVVSCEPLSTAASWYEDFSPVSDDEVRKLLDRGREDARLTLLAGWQRYSAPSFTGLSPEGI